ncbi:MAG TPA: LysR substrate-binding domain-containing protein [Streptosporangiaceae bacterium]|nr:LysR substrate-binding domain-containing protein [Streptosporangiaceae bacterium]
MLTRGPFGWYTWITVPSGKLLASARSTRSGWRDYWLATGERQGHPVRIGAVTDQPGTWLTAIANGDGIAVAPESAARYYARPGISESKSAGRGGAAVGHGSCCGAKALGKQGLDWHAGTHGRPALFRCIAPFRHGEFRRDPLAHRASGPAARPDAPGSAPARPPRRAGGRAG